MARGDGTHMLLFKAEVRKAIRKEACTPRAVCHARDTLGSSPAALASPPALG